MNGLLRSVAVVESATSSGFMAPLHAHDADEAVHVVEGGITLYAGEKTVRLEAAETFLVPRGVAHTYRADSSPARSLFTTVTPSAGRYEDFLRATGPVTVGPSGAAVWAGSEDARAVGAVATAASISVYGPPGLLPTGAETAAQAA